MSEFPRPYFDPPKTECEQCGQHIPDERQGHETIYCCEPCRIKAKRAREQWKKAVKVAQ